MITRVLKGKLSPTELRPVRYVMAFTNPSTGEMTARDPYESCRDEARIQRNEQLLKQAETDPSITVIRIVYTDTPTSISSKM
jgi:hypothetical protein